MPSRNSVNKPKIKISTKRHASTLGKRRSARAARVATTRSSSSRYADTAAPTPTESTAVALYTGAPQDNTAITTKTLSNKRAKKIARNQKYVAQRKQQEMMDDDGEAKAAAQTRLEKTREALWKIVADRQKNGFVKSTDGEGTTLGMAAY